MLDTSTPLIILELGNYVSPMTPAEVITFVQGKQAMWKPVREQIAAQPAR